MIIESIVWGDYGCCFTDTRCKFLGPTILQPMCFTYDDGVEYAVGSRGQVAVAILCWGI